MVLLLGYGLIGKALYRKLSEQQLGVKVFANDFPQEQIAGAIQGDFLEIDKHASIFQDVTTVVHLIHTTVPYSSALNPLLDLHQNVAGTIKLLELLKQKPQTRVIYLSSGGAVYGTIGGDDDVTEDYPTCPISPYGISKLMLEKYLFYYSRTYGLKCTILRPSNVYGPRQDLSKIQGVIGHIVRSINEDSEFRLWGDGSARKDYLFVDDMAEAIHSALMAPPETFGIYNVSSHEAYSVRQIITKIEALKGKSLKFFQEPHKIFDVENILIDSSRFREAYRWAPVVDFDSGLKKVIQSLQDH